MKTSNRIGIPTFCHMSRYIEDLGMALDGRPMIDFKPDHFQITAAHNKWRKWLENEQEKDKRRKRRHLHKKLF